ncbi:MAG: site-specific DNA-methyltransferase, partial [Chloroflexi bacterium]|nr:site-specific DNA-methyltransferase [Chloroflexota bacterium]
MDETRPRPEPVAATSTNPLAGRLEQLQQLFPEAFSEGQVDFERLRAALGNAVNDGSERYSFTWAGKREAMRILQMPTRATLLPAPEESVNWDTTRHLFIEGDNLEVLKLMLKPYYGRVKMIYIDPPYNTGNDFIYPDNYADPLDTYLRLTGQKDAAGNLLTSNPETSGRYHSAWLSM